jgi:NitT/TauT family transport system substrate-binding protein
MTPFAITEPVSKGPRVAGARMWGRLLLATVIATAACGDASMAQAAEKVICLIAAPLSRPAFAPWVVAQQRGYFAKEGLDIDFQIVGGGAEIAKQVGLGNAVIGGALGDTSIIVRSRGIPVKSVAVVGGGGFTQLIVREDSPIKTPADLRGKTVTVLSYQDTTYYALLGALASAGMTKNDLNVLAGGPRNTWAMFLTGQADAISSAPDYIAFVTAAGVKPRVMPINDFFETMAQAAVASDKMIKENPELIRRIVRPLLRGMTDIMSDPAGTLTDFIKGTPDNAGKETELAIVFGYYNKNVFPGQKIPGEMDERRLAKLQEFYLREGIIDKATPVNELYTNEFVR